MSNIDFLTHFWCQMFGCKFAWYRKQRKWAIKKYLFQLFVLCFCFCSRFYSFGRLFLYLRRNKPLWMVKRIVGDFCSLRGLSSSISFSCINFIVFLLGLLHRRKSLRNWKKTKIIIIKILFTSFFMTFIPILNNKTDISMKRDTKTVSPSFLLSHARSNLNRYAFFHSFNQSIMGVEDNKIWKGMLRFLLLLVTIVLS